MTPEGFGVTDTARLSAIGRNGLLHLHRGIAPGAIIRLVANLCHQPPQPLARHRPLRADVDERVRLKTNSMPRTIVISVNLPRRPVALLSENLPGVFESDVARGRSGAVVIVVIVRPQD